MWWAVRSTDLSAVIKCLRLTWRIVWQATSLKIFVSTCERSACGKLNGMSWKWVKNISLSGWNELISQRQFPEAPLKVAKLFKSSLAAIYNASFIKGFSSISFVSKAWKAFAHFSFTARSEGRWIILGKTFIDCNFSIKLSNRNLWHLRWNLKPSLKHWNINSALEMIFKWVSMHATQL